MGIAPIAGPVAGFAIFAVIAFSCACYRRRRLRDINISRSMRKQPVYAQQVKDWMAQREVEIGKRKAEEEEHNNGS